MLLDYLLQKNSDGNSKKLRAVAKQPSRALIFSSHDERKNKCCPIIWIGAPSLQEKDKTLQLPYRLLPVKYRTKKHLNFCNSVLHL